MVVKRDEIVDDFLSGGPLESTEVIDCHMHMGLALYMQVMDSDPHGMVKRLDGLGISTACISHSCAMTSDPILGNTLQMEACSLYPDRIFGYAFYSPRYPDEMDAEMKRCSDGGLKGLKIHPDFHRTPADSPLYDPLYERAVKENRILLCHYGAGRGQFAGSHMYNSVVNKYPDAVYIMAHSLPGMEAVDTAVEYFGDNPNVNFCLANAFEPGVIEYACEKIGEQRLLFGSDGGWGSVAARLGLICCTDIPVQTKRNILGLNMKRILASVA